MPQYRLAILQTFARQLAFAPLEVRHAQLAAAETLLHDLDPAKSYPSDFVTFRITGYQPRTRVQAETLTGLALQHDLCVLIEAVSAGMGMRAGELAEPVLSIDDVTARFNVTSKTIQRWRRKGLVSRRFLFADGKNRVGFLLSSIERFIARHREAVVEGANLSAMTDVERDAIVRHARRLAAECGCTERELTHRLARRFRRSALTILHTLRKHDQTLPLDAVLPLAVPEISTAKRAKVIRAFRRGWSPARIARRIGRRRSSVYRILMDDRADRVQRRRATFHDDELYHGPDAEAAVRAIVRASQVAASKASSSEAQRVPPHLPPYIADLYRTPLLTPAQERALFLELNWRKYQFVLARRRFDPETARKRDVERLEELLGAAGEVKNRIVAANLRLVVSVARKHVPGGARSDAPPTLMDLVSEGNLILMRAAESFDIHKNVRFSTYATFALMKGFARLVPELRARASIGVDVGEIDVADGRSSPHHQRLADREEVARLMSHLSPSERRIVSAHYGIGPNLAGQDAAGATYEELGRALGIPRHRVRQIEKRAIEKLRSLAN